VWWEEGKAVKENEEEEEEQNEDEEKEEEEEEGEGEDVVGGKEGKGPWGTLQEMELRNSEAHVGLCAPKSEMEARNARAFFSQFPRSLHLMKTYADYEHQTLSKEKHGAQHQDK
jgi:hypothetical protein